MITFTFFLGSPTFEEGLYQFTTLVFEDELEVIENYIESKIEAGSDEYIILRDGIPFKWSMTDCKGDTHEGY